MDSHGCLRRLHDVSWVIKRLKVGFWMRSRIINVTTSCLPVNRCCATLRLAAEWIAGSHWWVHAVPLFRTLNGWVFNALDSCWFHELALYLEFINLEAFARFIERTLGWISLRGQSEAHTSLRRLKVFANNMSGIKRCHLLLRLIICGAPVLTSWSLFTHWGSKIVLGFSFLWNSVLVSWSSGAFYLWLTFFYGPDRSYRGRPHTRYLRRSLSLYFWRLSFFIGCHRKERLLNYVEF